MEEESSFFEGLNESLQSMERAIEDPDTLVLRNMTVMDRNVLISHLYEQGVTYENVVAFDDVEKDKDIEPQRTVYLPADTPIRVARRVLEYLEGQTGEQGFRIFVKERPKE